MVAPVPWGRGEQWDSNYTQAQESTVQRGASATVSGYSSVIPREQLFFPLTGDMLMLLS